MAPINQSWPVHKEQIATRDDPPAGVSPIVDRRPPSHRTLTRGYCIAACSFRPRQWQAEKHYALYLLRATPRRPLESLCAMPHHKRLPSNPDSRAAKCLSAALHARCRLEISQAREILFEVDTHTPGPHVTRLLASAKAP